MHVPGATSTSQHHDPQRAVNAPLCLVTGGAGFLGINLVRHLLAAGYRARSLDLAPFDYPERGVVDVIQGDIRDRSTVERAMHDASIVIHAAAALPLYRKEAIQSTEVDGTRTVLDAALRHRVSRCIYISSTAVYGIPNHHPIHEDDRLHGVGPYGIAKIDAEAICGEYRAKGLCVPILRPKTFVGPERLGVFTLLYEWAYEGRNFPILGHGRNRYQLLDVEDLCRAIVCCATCDAQATNDVFNVGAREFGSLRDDFQAVLDQAGHGGRIVAIPGRLVIALLRVASSFRLSPLYPWVYETMMTESFVSTERIERQLGFTPKYSNREALIRNYDWYVEHRDEASGRYGISHRAQWRPGLLRFAKPFF